MALIAAYKTGAYSQREIGEYYQLHPRNDGWCYCSIVRKNKNSWLWTSYIDTASKKHYNSGDEQENRKTSAGQ
ncbi:MAG: hypothetical protein IPP22_09745 [Nitrosomonas sp.]|nr:hypothetical protein [Nitrosomonas sp.]